MTGNKVIKNVVLRTKGGVLVYTRLFEINSLLLLLLNVLYLNQELFTSLLRDSSLRAEHFAQNDSGRTQNEGWL